MPSTYTTNGGIELISTGEQSGTWGVTTNLNLQIIDRLTNGVGAIALSGTTHTLTTSDGSLSDGQYSVLVFGGAPSGTNTVTLAPNDAQHTYVVKNNSGESVVLTQGSGGNVTIADGKSAIVYADGAGAGAAVVDVTATLDFQTASATLTAIAALATTDGNFIVGNGSTWVAESGSTARTSLGLGSIATQNSDNVAITGGSISGITDLAVSDGGTGASSFTANNVLLGNDASSFQVVAPGTSGNLLTSNGVTWTSEPLSSSVVTLTGTQTLTNKTLGGVVINDGYTEEVFAVSGTTPALSPTNGSIQTWTLSGNSTPTAGTWAAGQSLTLQIDDGTDYTITWTSLSVTWKTGAGSAPTLNTSGDTVIQLWKVGSTIYGARVGDA